MPQSRRAVPERPVEQFGKCHMGRPEPIEIRLHRTEAAIRYRVVIGCTGQAAERSSHMRVALIGTASADYCLELADILAQTCEVLLCMSDRYGGMTLPRRGPNLEVAWFSVPRHRQLKSVLYLLRLRLTIRKWGPDLVHFLMENHVWLNLLPSLLGPLPIITTVHDVEHHPGDHSSRRVPRFLSNS